MAYDLYFPIDDDGDNKIQYTYSHTYSHKKNRQAENTQPHVLHKW